MRKTSLGKKALILCITLVFALGVSGCGDAGAKTMLALNKEYAALQVVEQTGEVSLEVSLSDAVYELLGEYRPTLEQFLGMFENMSYASKSDARNMTVDFTLNNRGGELMRVILDTPGSAYYIDMLGYLRQIDAIIEQIDNLGEVPKLEDDLQGNQWIQIDMGESTQNALSAFSADQVALVNDVLADYLAGLEDAVFADFDSGLVKDISGGFEFKITYEQVGPYILAIGTYTLEHLDAFGAYTKTFLQGMTGEQLAVFNLTEEDRDEAVSEIDAAVTAAKENKAAFENYLAMAASYVQMPDVAKLLGGSYISLSLVKKGATFTVAYDILINANFDGTSFASTMGMDFGSNSLRMTATDNAKEISGFTLEVPTAGVINAEDTEYFSGSGDIMESFFNGLAYGYGGYGYDPYGYGYDEDFSTEDWEDWEEWELEG
ncbi:MAG: hypothetical protein LBQ16_06905 [Gracilibacteraceae bacterium]|jgi:hypothetical protein|nr:hypothetical protein [Gracilibacteraceae bacterium]